MFFERLIRFSLKGKLDLINHLGGISTVEGSHTVIENLVRLVVTPLTANWAWSGQTRP